MRQRVQGLMRATLRTRRGRAVLALVALIVLAGGGYTVTEHGATSLRIIAQPIITGTYYGQPVVPAERAFDKTFEDFGLVRDAQELLNGESRGWLQSGSCDLGSPTYIYEFRFATLGVTTQVHKGNAECAVWGYWVLGVPSPWSMGASPPTLKALHNLTGMPLPRWMTTDENTDAADRM